MTDGLSTILVVDDDADARLIMSVALRNAGFEVRLASGGHDALHQFQAQPSDLVMLDVDMPDLGGYDVCIALRALAGPLLPIVMVTGMDDLKSIETAYGVGATDFITKPVNWALIGHRVRYLMRGHQALLDLQAAEARHAAVLNAIPDLLFEADVDGRIVDYRAPQQELLAVPPEAFLGRTVEQVLPADAAGVCMAALRTADEHGSSSGMQYELELPGGRRTWFELSVARKAAIGSGRTRFIVLARDISERKQAEANIARLAYFDSLTGLPNRRSFLERVDREIRRAEARHGRLAVLFMDLDGFKNVNDTLGHAVGDQLLQWAAERLHDGLRPSDLLSRPLDPEQPGGNDVGLARLGGDEFTALILGIHSADEALSVANRIGSLMRQPFVIEGREVTLTASTGIALYPENGLDGATLLKHADTAMYEAKRSGRDNAQVYSATLTQDILRRLEIETSLRSALERREFHLVYQPQVDTFSGRVHGVEALIRWIHPQWGPVPPLDFIPLAEACGLIERIGRWVLHAACEQAAQWNRDLGPLTVAVNLSPLQATSAEFPRLVGEVLERSGLAPDRLELEVTEGALMENTATTRAVLQSLRAQGVHIALDDFGTGYSSLAYLTRMPIGNIKVDRCFVAGLLQGGESEAIVRAVLAMAHSLGMRVTAEGVETVEQAQALAAMGCDRLQGYHIGRPLSAPAAAALIARLAAEPDPAPPAGAAGAAGIAPE